MSYIKIFDDVDMTAFQQLVLAKLIGPAAGSINQSSLAVKLSLTGERFKRQQIAYELRISKSLVKSLVTSAISGYNTHIAHRISLLYRTGLGLPKSRECHLLWEHIAAGYAPSIHGKVFSYRDMCNILKAHWKQANQSNIDPNWMYFNPHQDYFKQLIEPTFNTVVKQEFVEKRSPYAAFPKVEGLDCTLVYRVSLDGVGRLYAAYANVKNKMLNVTVQALNAPSIPKTIGPVEALSQFGPFVLVSGSLTIKRRAVNKLKQYWGKDNSVLSLIKSSLDQDVYSLYELDSVELPRSHPSIQFIGKYRQKYRKAQKFVEACKAKKLKRNETLRLDKALKLIRAFEEHQETVKENKEQQQKLKDFDIVKKLEFVALDLYGYENGAIKRVTNPYEGVNGFIKKLGFVSPALVQPTSTVNGTVKRLESKSSLIGYLTNGVIYRLSDNSKKVKAVNWVKVSN
ncbi:hypothetical protein BN7874_075 [Phage NCTB]|nr:hypothetical protein BN7874_075 [Phage NCTB]